MELMDRQLLDTVRRLALLEFREESMLSNLEGERAEAPTELAKRLGLPFTDMLLLARALTHRSYINEHPELLEDNERLEFLGDAVLDFVVGAWLYNHFPEAAEGDLTRMRSALVCTEQLAEFARTINLGYALRLGRGEAQAGGRKRDVLLCAAFEALIGALYIQTSIDFIQNFLNSMLGQASQQFLLQSELDNPKSRLQEWSQAKRLGIPKYVTIQAIGPDHDKIFEVEVYINGELYGHGSGHSKNIASHSAAQNALDHIEEKS